MQKQKWTELKDETDNLTITDFNISISIANKTTKQKITKGV